MRQHTIVTDRQTPRDGIGLAACMHSVARQKMAPLCNRFIEWSSFVYDQSGVFVMVTIGLSTASVITSIFVFRINDNTSPLPRGVRLVAFQYLARFMCVRVSWPTTSSSSRSSVVPDDSSCGRTSSNCSAKVTANPVSAATRRTVADVDDTRASSTSAGCCCQLKPQVDSVLCELRKVIYRITGLGIL